MSQLRSKKAPVAKMDVTEIGKVTPVSASEKLAQMALLGAQIDNSDYNEDKKKALKLAIHKMSEVERVKSDTLLKISQFTRSTPEWYQLVSVCGGEEDPFKQSEIIADKIFKDQEYAHAMELFAPSKTSVRESFIKASKTAVAARSESNKDGEATITRKTSVAAAAVARATTGGM